MDEINTKKLVAFLKSRNKNTSDFISSIKISYRPYICPFIDLLNKLPKEAKVFDIGCGSGMFLSLVSEFKNPLAVAGIEIDSKLIDNANKVFENKNNISVRFLTYDGITLPETIANYNFIYLIDVLHHVPIQQQSNFLEQIYTKMSVGSVLVIKDINAKSFLAYWNKIHDILLSGEIGHEPNPIKLKKQMKNIGFNVSEIKYKRMLLYPHFTIYCTK